MNATDKLIMGQARSQNGDSFEMEMVSEECSELVHALHKHRRYKTAETKQHVIEEIADVKIMIHQAEQIYGKDAIHKAITFKMERLGKRLMEERNKYKRGNPSPI